jgi:hypothetical protein
VDYISRDQWGARPPKAKTILTPGQIEGIFVHHTVTGTGPDEAAIVRQVQAFHMDSKGWNDIAYNWLVGQSGNIYEGRGWLANGGHTQGWNFTSHAVCFIGNSDTDVPSEAAKRSLNIVIEESLKRFGGFVKPHGAVNETGCPGQNLAKWIVEGRQSAPLPTIPSDPYSPSEDDVEAPIILRNVFSAPYLCPSAGKNGLAILLKTNEDVALAKFLGAVEKPGDGTPFLRLMYKVDA